MSRKNTLLASLAAAPIALGMLTACAAPATTASPSVPPASSAPSATSTAPAPATGSGTASATATITSAIDAALKAVPGAVVDVDAQDDPGVAWDVVVRTADGRGVEVTLDSALRPVAQEPTDVPDAAVGGAPAIAAKTAVAAALNATPGAPVTGLDLDDLNDTARVVWEVRSASGVTNVDAASGRIVR